MRSPTTPLACLALLVGLAACEQRPLAPTPSNVLPDGKLAVASIMSAARGTHTPPTHVAARIAGRHRTAVLGDMSAMAAGPEFEGLYRYPAEERSWLTMENDTAYYRDAFVSGDQFISHAVDGQSWYARALGPNNTVVTWQTITFHADYNGRQNCFVTSAWALCDSDAMYIEWYMGSQCLPPGAWRIQFFQDGQMTDEHPFTLKPQIPPGKVPLLNQGAYPTTQYSNTCTLTTDGSDRHRCDGRANEKIFTIRQLGCALTSAAMTLGYHGVHVTPDVLNTWLRDNNGYSGTAVDFNAVARYARTEGGTNITYLGRIQVHDDAALQQAICQYGPHPINVYGSNGRPTGHFVAATGRDLELTTFRINDPAGGVERTLRDRNYANTHAGRRVFAGPQFSYTDPLSGMEFFFHSPGELLVTDAQGRRTGYDPLTATSYAEIPGASYDSTADGDPDDPSFQSHTVREFEFLRAPAGTYTVTVTGTGTGTYLLDLRSYGQTGEAGTSEFVDVPIVPGVTHSYTLTHDPARTTGGTIALTGGFAGGGQSASVDDFLTYSAPTERQIALPAGTTSYPLMVFFGRTIDPTTFTAELNGQSVTALFTPTPGGMNVVSLPVAPGRNVLLLRVRGANGSRMPRDADRLVLKVP